MMHKTALDPVIPDIEPTRQQEHDRVEIFSGRRARRALAVGPVLSVITLYVGGALHPKDYKSAAPTLHSVFAHQNLWALSHVLMAVGAFAFALTAPGFLLLARGRGAAAIRVGAAASAVGMLAVAVDPIAHGFVYSLLANPHVPGGVASEIFNRYEHHSLISALMPASILLPLGFLLIAFGQLRGRNRLAGWALVVGTIVAFAVPGQQLMFAVVGLPLIAALATAARRAYRSA